MRVLSDIVRDSKIMYSMDRQPRTVLGTSPPTMSEQSLRRYQMSMGKRQFADYNTNEESATSARSQSRVDPDSILGRHGLELTADTKRLRLKRRGAAPRLDEVEGLHMSYMLAGPKSARLNSTMKDYLRANSSLS